MFKKDIGKNGEKTDEMAPEINRLIKAIRASTHKDREHPEIFLRVNDLRILRTETKILYTK